MEHPWQGRLVGEDGKTARDRLVASPTESKESVMAHNHDRTERDAVAA